ncbi:MAG: substrate-binding domain-containing protein [Clostridiales bacterium]|nr:substrate-binding domain-containing protein [Clostridiales bacterium]
MIRRATLARATLALAAFFCLLPLFSSCDRDAEPPPAPDMPAAHPVYAMIVKEKTNPYMLKMYEGFETACAEIGAEASFCGPDEYTAEAQTKIIDRLVEEGGVDAIAIAANDADALGTSLCAAMDKGIKVLSLDSAVNPEHRMLHVQQASPEKIGRVLVQAAYKMIGGKGKVGLISSTEYATNQKLWISWMRREISENPAKYDGFTLLPTLYGEDRIDKSSEMAKLLLDEYDDVSLIVTPSVVGMLAVGRTLSANGSDVLFTGLGLPSEMADYIETGSCPWMYLWNPIDIGYLAAYSADALHTGQISGLADDVFSAGRIGQRIVTEGADGGTETLLGDPVKFDADNIGEWKTVY